MSSLFQSDYMSSLFQSVCYIGNFINWLLNVELKLGIIALILIWCLFMIWLMSL